MSVDCTDDFVYVLQVEVKEKKTAYAALVVHEENFDAEIKVTKVYEIQ